MALEYFLIASEMFHGYFQKKVGKSGDYRKLVKDHEGRLSVIFDIMPVSYTHLTLPTT